jgi:uncharacterized protein YjdB
MRKSHRMLSLFALTAVFTLAACDSSTDPGPPAGPIVAELEVTPSEVTFIALGQTEIIEATARDEDEVEIEDPDITWSSSDEDVATVNDAGVVEAVGNGEATITAEAGDVSASVEVTVEQVAHEVQVSASELVLTEIGETAELSATVHDEEGVEIEGAQVTWSSSDESVATVDEDGVVEAVGEGTAIITAESGDAEGTIEVTVELDA